MELLLELKPLNPSDNVIDLIIAIVRCPLLDLRHKVYINLSSSYIDLIKISRTTLYIYLYTSRNKFNIIPKYLMYLRQNYIYIPSNKLPKFLIYLDICGELANLKKLPIYLVYFFSSFAIIQDDLEYSSCLLYLLSYITIRRQNIIYPQYLICLLSQSIKIRKPLYVLQYETINYHSSVEI
jgi:hypothetical protein